MVALRRDMLRGAINRPLAVPIVAKRAILKVGNVTSCGAALCGNLLRSVSHRSPNRIIAVPMAIAAKSFILKV